MTRNGLKETAVSWRDDAVDGSSEPEARPLFANLVPPVLGLVGIGVLACAMWALNVDDDHSGAELRNCAVIADGPARLACFDELTMPHQPARGALAPVRTHQPEE
jgi:hypothetical protein